MSDLRLTAVCTECKCGASGSSTLEQIADHMDDHPDHRVTVTRSGRMTGITERRGWFADWDNDGTNEYGWQPCLETGQGHIPSFEVWFKSKAECEDWIRENVLGVGWFPDEPSA